jgi:hypothetical protein
MKAVPLQQRRDAWKDLGNIMLEERWRIEERKEIIGEEWRKISRILDRYKQEITGGDVGKKISF